LECFLASRFGSVCLFEARGLMARWRLTDVAEVQVAGLLQQLQDNKAALGLSDCACSQATLEHVFNALAAEQRPGPAVPAVAPGPLEAVAPSAATGDRHPSKKNL